MKPISKLIFLMIGIGLTLLQPAHANECNHCFTTFSNCTNHCPQGYYTIYPYICYLDCLYDLRSCSTTCKS
jgi:hypothetical protein